MTDIKENMDVVVAYTKQFIEAATPVAKMAYEVGLTTIRIDALQSIIPALIVLIVVFFVCRKIRTDYVAAKIAKEASKRSYSYVTDYMFCEGFPHIVIGIFAFIGGFVAIVRFMNIWTWTKLISPQLWLAHQAIEKLVK